MNSESGSTKKSLTEVRRRKSISLSYLSSPCGGKRLTEMLYMSICFCARFFFSSPSGGRDRRLAAASRRGKASLRKSKCIGYLQSYSVSNTSNIANEHATLAWGVQETFALSRIAVAFFLRWTAKSLRKNVAFMLQL